MNDAFDTTPSAQPRHDGGFSPGAAAPVQAEHLARRLYEQPDLLVRVPLRGDGSPCTPELHDGERVVGRTSLRVVEILVEAGALRVTSETPIRRVLAYCAAPAETDRRKPSPSEPEPIPEPKEDPMPDSDRGPVTVPPLGSTIDTHRLAEIFGWANSMSASKPIRQGKFTAEKEDPGNSRSPYRITVDEKLVAELKKRGIPYTIEAEPYTKPAESYTRPAGAETRAVAPPASVPDEAVAARSDGLGGGWGPGDEDEPGGDGIAVDLSEVSDEDVAEITEEIERGGRVRRADHPVEAIAAELDASRDDAPIELLLDAVRDAALRFAHRTLFGVEAGDVREEVRRAVDRANDALDEARLTVEEAERIAGLNELPAVRTSGRPHEEES